MYFLFDIGGTKMRFSSSVDGVNIDGVEIVDTPVLFDKGLEQFSLMYDKFSKMGSIDKISGGIAGIFDKERRILLDSYNLPDWKNRNISQIFTDKFKCRINLDNDAALEGLGEAVYGVGKGYKIVAYLTVGTGLGGARIVDGAIDVRNTGFEPGHQIMDTTNLTDLGDLVSGGGFKIRFGVDARRVTDGKIWAENERILAIGIHNTIVHWSPEIVILGGGLIEEEKYKIENLNNLLLKLSKNYPYPANIVKSSLGDKAGLLGALHMARI